MKNKNKKINWLDNPAEKDFIAAISYLSLLFSETQVKEITEKLKKVKITHFKAKDIFRASSLSLLGISNIHIKNNIEKIEKGDFLSPILLVRGVANEKLIVADGYHRLCAVYQYNEDDLIPCQIV